MRVTQTVASATEVAAFRCVHCGHRARAEVTGIGEGAQTFLNAGGVARQRALEDAHNDVARTIARVRCPKCQRRDPKGVRMFFKRDLIVAAAIAVFGVLVGVSPYLFGIDMARSDKHLMLWLGPVMFLGPMLLIMPTRMWSRWSTTEQRVNWLPDGEAPPPPAAG